MNYYTPHLKLASVMAGMYYKIINSEIAWATLYEIRMVFFIIGKIPI